MPLPFVGPFVYSSHGHIDAFGLAPDQYSKSAAAAPPTSPSSIATTKQIVYTRTPASQPLADGAQDRFSVVMQLASLVRGSPDTYKPGVTRQFFVVDNDSGENWPIETVGDETVQRAVARSARAISRACRATKATGGASTYGLRRRWAGCPRESCRPNRTARRSNCSGAASFNRQPPRVPHRPMASKPPVRARQMRLTIPRPTPCNPSSPDACCD